MDQNARGKSFARMKPSRKPELTKSQHRMDTETELWICEQLKLPHLFAGYTDKGMRAERLKVVLLSRGLTNSEWRSKYRALYGSEL